MYGKSKEWRDAADRLLIALAKNNQYIVSDMLIIFLESSGFGLDDYSPLGGVFKRAAKGGIIKRVKQGSKQTLWISKIYNIIEKWSHKMSNDNSQSGRPLTQKQKILKIMCRQPNKWFFPYEFMKPSLGPLFVGYKAPTRISEMHKDISTLFEKKFDDKYMQRKLNIKQINSWYSMLPDNLKQIIDDAIASGSLKIPVSQSVKRWWSKLMKG